jgi:hypothetical protein
MSNEEGPCVARKRTATAPAFVWIRYSGAKQDHAAFLINETDKYVDVKWDTINKCQLIPKKEVTIIHDSDRLDRRGRPKRSNNDVVAVPNKKATGKQTPDEQQPPPKKRGGSSSANRTLAKNQPVAASTKKLAHVPLATISFIRTRPSIMSNESDIDTLATAKGSVDPTIAGRIKRRRRRHMDRNCLAAVQEETGETQNGGDEFDFHEAPGERRPTETDELVRVAGDNFDFDNSESQKTDSPSEEEWLAGVSYN